MCIDLGLYLPLLLLTLPPAFLALVSDELGVTGPSPFVIALFHRWLNCPARAGLGRRPLRLILWNWVADRLHRPGWSYWRVLHIRENRHLTRTHAIRAWMSSDFGHNLLRVRIIRSLHASCLCLTAFAAVPHLDFQLRMSRRSPSQRGHVHSNVTWKWVLIDAHLFSTLREPEHAFVDVVLS